MKTVIFLIADQATVLNKFAKLLQQQLPGSALINFKKVLASALNAASSSDAKPAVQPASKLLDALLLAIEATGRQTVIIKGLDWYKNPMAATLNNKAALALGSKILFVLSKPQNLNSWMVTLTLAAKNTPTGLWLAEGCACPAAMKPFLAGYFGDTLQASQLTVTHPALKHHLTPTMLRYYILTQARRANLRILLPEPEDPRVMEAACYCERSGIARCVFIGDRKRWEQYYAKKHGFKLEPSLTFIDPKEYLLSYAQQYYELRKDKGVTLEMAKQAVLEPTVLGMMLLKNGKAAGLVSGACHTTADTLRPAFQLIKTKPGHSLVSSAFLVCFPEEVRVMADCAVNPNPSAEQLATITKQTYQTARSLGIEPKVAMLSYSTINSGKGPDVDLVQQAKELLLQENPKWLVDGPLQYDAAIDVNVAKLKAPHSKVAGKANVLIFPNLTAGNIGYKIAQRSADLVCMGPILQGLNQPVNDLSRGCSVEDVVFTIALTALQAIQK